MIQELINNCIKHAKASYAEISVCLRNNQVSIKVEDNGIGLNPYNDKNVNAGSGLSGIRNRVYLLNGQIKFNNSKKGLAVTITFENSPELSV